MQELYKDRLSAIDDVMFQALKAVFDERIEKEKPFINTTDDNNLLGQKYRTYEESKDLIKKVFIDIKSYKTGNTPNKGFAKER